MKTERLIQVVKAQLAVELDGGRLAQLTSLLVTLQADRISELEKAIVKAKNPWTTKDGDPSLYIRKVS